MSAGSSGEGEGDDFELNLAPIIDCFTVLITYMLVSASFISIHMLDVQVAAASPASSSESATTPRDSLTLELHSMGNLEFVLNGKQEVRFAVPANGGQKNLDRMLTQIDDIKSKWPSIDEVSIKADNGISYKEVVGVIEALKPKVGKVFLGE